MPAHVVHDVNGRMLCPATQVGAVNEAAVRLFVCLTKR